MALFYIHIADQLEGPFTLKALKEKQIPRDTMIWTEGQGDWIPLGQLNELGKIFGSAPLPTRQHITKSLQAAAAPYLNRSFAYLVASLLVCWGISATAAKFGRRPATHSQQSAILHSKIGI